MERLRAKHREGRRDWQPEQREVQGWPGWRYGSAPWSVEAGRSRHINAGVSFIIISGPAQQKAFSHHTNAGGKRTRAAWASRIRLSSFSFTMEREGGRRGSSSSGAKSRSFQNFPRSLRGSTGSGQTRQTAREAALELSAHVLFPLYLSHAPKSIALLSSFVVCFAPPLRSAACWLPLFDAAAKSPRGRRAEIPRLAFWKQLHPVALHRAHLIPSASHREQQRLANPHARHYVSPRCASPRSQASAGEYLRDRP